VNFYLIVILKRHHLFDLFSTNRWEHSKIYVRRKLNVLEAEYPKIDSPGLVQKWLESLPQGYRDASPKGHVLNTADLKNVFENVCTKLHNNRG